MATLNTPNDKSAATALKNANVASSHGFARFLSQMGRVLNTGALARSK